MNPKRKQRLYVALFIALGSAAAIGLFLVGLGENVNMFYPPEEVANGNAPEARQIRAGGMVLEGSWQRSGATLEGSFVLTDRVGHDFKVHYDTILPDLFREGQGVIVEGQLNAQREFVAERVLAKHDENYMPPELADMGHPTGVANTP